MGLDQNTFERQGAIGPGDPGDLLLRPDRQPVPAGGRRRQHGRPLLSAAVPSLRGAGNGGERPQRSRGRDPPGGHPRFRLAEAQGGRGVAARNRPDREPTERDHVKGGRRRSAVRVRAAHRVRPQRRAGDGRRHRSTGTAEHARDLHPDQLRRVRQRLQRQRTLSSPLRRGRSLHPRRRPEQRRQSQRRRQLLAVAELRRRPVRGLPAALHQAGGKLFARLTSCQASTNPATTYDDEMYSVRLRFAFYF